MVVGAWEFKYIYVTIWWGGVFGNLEEKGLLREATAMEMLCS